MSAPELQEAQHPEQEDALASQLELAHTTVVQATREHPHLAVAAAFAVGTVLGGGVPIWALRLAGVTVARVAAARAVATLGGVEGVTAPTLPEATRHVLEAVGDMARVESALLVEEVRTRAMEDARGMADQAGWTVAAGASLGLGAAWVAAGATVGLSRWVGTPGALVTVGVGWTALGGLLALRTRTTRPPTSG